LPPPVFEKVDKMASFNLESLPNLNAITSQLSDKKDQEFAVISLPNI
jgi:hypothetical protein